MKEDICGFVDEFYEDYITNGCNSLFITLIQKVHSPTCFKDYRLISLIGIQYKSIGKFLTNRLAKVIDSIVSPKQFAFIKGRQILNGPLMVNEILGWLKNRKMKSIVFKVDFDKAYDSIS